MHAVIIIKGLPVNLQLVLYKRTVYSTALNYSLNLPKCQWVDFSLTEICGPKEFDFIMSKFFLGLLKGFYAKERFVPWNHYCGIRECH